MLSQNGWPVLNVGDTYLWTIPGSGRHLRLSYGAAGFVLTHFALWFHETIEPIGDNTWDDWGYANRLVRGSSTSVSNHASGTAIDLNAQSHPLGQRKTFTGEQYTVIRERLGGRYGKAIRWGADYQNRADEMHFEICTDSSGVLAVARTLDDSRRGRRVRRANPRSGR